MLYKIAYWYAGYQVKIEKSGLTLNQAISLKQKLSDNKEQFVHYEIHKDKPEVKDGE